MKSLIGYVLLGLVAASGQASEATLQGRWVLTAEARAAFAPACRGMTLEFKDGNRIVRTTGELSYTTDVVPIADGGGWRLQERLLSQNGKPGCSGKSAEEILSHFDRQAYVETDGSTLRYHRAKGAQKVIEFTRVRAQQTAASGSVKRGA